MQYSQNQHYHWVIFNWVKTIVLLHTGTDFDLTSIFLSSGRTGGYIWAAPIGVVEIHLRAKLLPL